MSILITWVGQSSARDPNGGDIIADTPNELLLDGTISENYDVEALATEHPVEEGADITDHIRPSLRRVTLQVVHSDHPGPLTPTGDMPAELPNPFDSSSSTSGEASGSRSSSEGRAQSVRETVDRLILEGREVTITTAVRSYESMLLLNAAETRNPESGDGYRATITAREFRRVATDTVDAPSPRVERARAPAATGQQDGPAVPVPAPTTAAAATPAPDRRSRLLALLQRADPGSYGDPP